jgi:phage gpG-like protein
VELVISIFGDKQFSRRLLRFEDRMDDMSPAYEEVADYLLDVERMQFLTSGAYASGLWRPLAPSTVAKKLREGLDPDILHATLRLRASLTQRDHPDHVRRITADSLFFGTSAKSRKGYPYPAVHQHGSRDGRIPQRRPVALRRSNRQHIVKVLQRFLVEGVAL